MIIENYGDFPFEIGDILTVWQEEEVRLESADWRRCEYTYLTGPWTGEVHGTRTSTAESDFKKKEPNNV